MTDKKEKQKMLEAKYMEQQLLEQEIKQIQGSLQTIDNQIMEIRLVEHSIDELKKTKIGQGIFVPLSNGIFLKGKLVNNQKLLVNVGSGVVVGKSIEGTKGLLHKQLDELDKLRNQIMAQFQKSAMQLEEIRKEMEKLVSESG